MTFIKDFINVLSAGSISFLLLSSVFGFIIFFNLLVDLAYAWLDPTVKLR